MVYPTIQAKRDVSNNRRYACMGLLLALAYTVLRFELNIEYSGATWQQLYDLTAPIPFGYRILIPILSIPLVELGASVEQAYMLWELISALILIFSLNALFNIFLSTRVSQLVSLSFILLLPLAFLLNFKWPVFYPHDTMAMAVIALGLYAMLKQRWWLLFSCVLIGTFNRESTILLPLLFLAIYADKMPIKKVLFLASTLFITYFIVRHSVNIITHGNPMPYQSGMAFLKGENWRVNDNLSWLSKAKNLFILCSSLGFLPLLYLFLSKYIPPPLRKISLVVMSYFIMLMFIGNLYEPRIFGELIVVLYFPVILAIVGYISDKPIRLNVGQQQNGALSTFVVIVDKYGLYALLAVSATIVIIIDQLGVNYFYP